MIRHIAELKTHRQRVEFGTLTVRGRADASRRLASSHFDKFT